MCCLGLIWLGACGGGAGTGAVQNTSTTPAEFSASLPAPQAVWRGISATGGQHCDGSAFEAAVAGFVSASGTSAQFSPNWQPGAGQHDFAYALYVFDIAQLQTQATLELHWQSAPEYWIGVAHAARGCWEWHAQPDGDSLALTLAPYRFENTKVMVVVAVLGTEQAMLDALDLETGTVTPLSKLFFLHHSTGWGIISEGNVRGCVADYNATHATAFEFWDQGYNGDGVRDQDGAYYDTTYFVPNDNTDPDGLHYLWTSNEADAVACRDGFLATYDVIAFKSCFPASGIYDAAMLQQYKDWYLAIRDTLDLHPDKLFVVMSTPPLVPAATNAEDAARARQFANWFKNSGYLTGHPNIVYFDLFDALAAPIGSGPEANMLRAEYRGTIEGDSHPNAVGNAAVGPVFAQFLIDSALACTP
jgi:hypothetical protein